MSEDIRVGNCDGSTGGLRYWAEYFGLYCLAMMRTVANG